MALDTLTMLLIVLAAAVAAPLIVDRLPARLGVESLFADVWAVATVPLILVLFLIVRGGPTYLMHRGCSDEPTGWPWPLTRQRRCRSSS